MFDERPLQVEFVEGGAAVLLRPLTWRTTTTLITVPTDFRTDGATIPAIVWFLLGHPFSYSILKSAVLHDYELTSGIAPPSIVHRRFYQSLRSRGNGRVRSALFFAGAWLGEIRRRLRRIRW